MKIIGLLILLGVNSSAFGAVNYEIHATVIEPELSLVFPAFNVSEEEPSGTSYADGCEYRGTLTDINEGTIQLEAIMSCKNDSVDYQMDMPIFVLSSKGESASYELVEGEIVTWKYDVEVNPIPSDTY